MEDVVCPYCDALNEQAVEHIREMNRYKREFEGTKENVYSVTKNYAGITVRIVILAVLVVLTIVCGILGGEVYSIRRNITQARRDDSKCKEIMEEYLAERDYYALSIFCEENSIYSSEEGFEEYDSIIYAANYYSYLYDSIMRTLKIYEWEDMQTYSTRIAQYLNDFCKIFKETDSYYFMGDTEKEKEVAAAMQEQIRALLMAYCGLTKEEAAALPDMSDAQRALVIEGGLLHE